MTKALIRLFIKNAEDTRSAAVREQYGILSGAVGLACNLFLFALKLTIGLVTGAISIAADAFNNLSDGLSCMISIVGFKVSNREPDEKHPFGYGRTEYIAGLIVSFIILLVGFEFFKTSLDRIIHPSAVAFSALLTGILAVSMLVKLWMGLFNTTLGRRIDSPVMAKNIEHIVLDSEHIVGVHDLIIHNYGAGRALASLHAEVPSDSNFVAVHEEIDEAEKRVWQQTGVYLVIHMDPIDVNDEHINALREQVDGVLRGIDEQLSMHDFRVVDGERQINLIFDVVVPFSYDDEGKRRLLMTIYDDLKAIDQRFNPVVTLDHAM